MIREVRIFLTGTVAFVSPGGIVDESNLPGPQGRLLVAFLVENHRRPVTKHEIADVLWGDELPPSWERSLRVLVSKTRAALSRFETDPDDSLLRGAFGAYRMFLPLGTVVDIEAARSHVHDAETAIAAHRGAEAGAAALVAQAITIRPFLPGIDNEWADQVRRDLEGLRLRALLAQGAAALELDDPHEAIRCSERALKLDPYRERALQTLVRGWTATGEHARARLAYREFSRRLWSELGAVPSPDTRALGEAMGAKG